MTSLGSGAAARVEAGGVAHVWSTAKVSWSPPDGDGLQWEQTDPDLTWKVGALPRMPNGRSVFGSALWGTSDADVHMGTFAGAILHWDGAAWAYTELENARPINALHGTGAANTWAVGRNGVVLHFDGARWAVVPLPGGVARGETLTGVWARSVDEVFICSTSGAIFHGNHRSAMGPGRRLHAA